MADLPELILFRHGETEWNLQGRWQGARDSALTARGRAQALALGSMFARMGIGPKGHALLSSPQPRASTTAELAFGTPPRTDSRLREIEVGEWTGVAVETIRQSPGMSADADLLDLYGAAPGGEGFDALEERCRSFLADLAGPTILVTHGMTARMLRTIVLGLPRAAISQLVGGQGIAFHLARGMERRLTPILSDWPDARP
ncbi:histidine phosphatase family protein [Jannaschia pohangensis]|uniref:Probable phosphoglycerate mutase n=1 Tax=Jannaschia pohangensis TaxID=390807 RepID=A0A1I3I1E0_9RHOB|nr:histidine phosphatase family protein [Jannaschia pohangensis]SFI41761.1 probable phosphoglycerate mutase [Jannaschia pohangensis]